jgi:hypothetical protein
MNPSYYDKWRYTLYTTFILLLLFNQYTIQFTQSLFKKFEFSFNNNIIFMIKNLCNTFFTRTYALEA